MILRISLQFCACGANDMWALGFGLDPTITTNLYSFTCWQEAEQTKFKQISTGAFFSIAVDENNDIFGWGQNYDFQLTSGLGEEVQKPTKIPYFSDNKIKVAMVAAGQWHSLVLAEDKRSLHSFGNNEYEQLGRAIEEQSNKVPGLVDISGLKVEEKIIDVQSIYALNYILTDQGNIYRWGECDNYRCFSETSDISEIPVLIQISQKVKKMFLLNQSFFYIDEKNELYSIGQNFMGQNCNGNDDPTYEPVKLNITNVQKVVGGESHTIILQNGKIFGCGDGSDGKLGTDCTTNCTKPTQLLKDKGKVIDVVATSYGTIVNINNQIYSTGSNDMGQLSLPDEKTYNEFTLATIDTNIISIQKLYSYWDSSFIIQGFPQLEEENENSKEQNENAENNEDGSEEDKDDSEIKNEPKPEPSTNNLSSGAIAGITICAIIVAALIAIGVYFLVKHLQKKKKIITQETSNVIQLYDTKAPAEMIL